MRSKDMDMLSGSLLKKIIIFTLPVMLSGILQLLFNACDLIVVGKFGGNESLAAVGSTGSLTNLIINLFIGVSIGANVAVARAIGKKDEKRAHEVVHTAILFSLIAGVFLTIFGVFTARFWLEVMDTTTESLDKATIYLQVYFGGMIFNMLYNFGASILRAVGETKKPLYFLIFAGVINVLLNLLFVICFKMDVAGVALATIISQAISAVLVVICLIRRSGIIHLDLKKLRIHKKALIQMILIGLPAGIQGSLFSISNVFIQKAVNSFASTAIVAGNTASSNIESFVYTAMNSFYQACITFTGQNYGAGKIKNCRKVFLYSQLCVLIVGIVFGGGVILFGESLLGLYVNDADAALAVEYGLIRLKILCSIYFLCGIMDVAVGALRGLGYSIVPMIVSILGVCVFRLVWIQTAFVHSHTLDTLYISYPISWLVTALIHLICLFFIFKRLKKKLPEQVDNSVLEPC